MNRSDAAREVKSRYAEYLQPAKKRIAGRPTFICPLCSNGTGKDGDGMSIDPHGDGTQLKCFKCGFYGDIVDLYQQQNACDVGAAFTALYDRFDITIDDNRAERPTEPRNEGKAGNVPPAQEKPAESPTEATEGKPDFTDYYKSCKEHITDPAAKAYLSFRGLSEETAARYWLGYDPATGFLIIPAARSFYIARNTDSAAKMRYKNPTGVSIELFNLKALYNDAARPVFITEGAIDALSIIEAGGEAVALNSTSNTRKLLKELESKRTGNALILCLDNDDAGRKASAELAEGLQQLNIAFTSANIAGQHKDANEALAADREAFIAAVQTTAKEIQYPGLLTTARAIATLEAVDDHYLELPHFSQLASTLKLKTHDTVVIAADTGAGKSSLALNFLHDLQEHYPALYINLEMDEATILQRLVAIHTGIELDRIEGYKHDANTRTEVNAAIAEIAARKEIQLLEDIYGLKQIEAAIQAATAGRKEPTMVFVDTGLLVTLPNKNASRYERFTQISEELRRISRLNNVVMFVLLQQNREGKKGDGKKEEQKPPTNSSLKESGSWENDATKIMFLWKNPQTGSKELVVTKNRSGRTGSITLDYNPRTQTYKEGRGFTALSIEPDDLPPEWANIPRK